MWLAPTSPKAVATGFTVKNELSDACTLPPLWALGFEEDAPFSSFRRTRSALAAGAAALAAALSAVRARFAFGPAVAEDAEDDEADGIGKARLLLVLAVTGCDTLVGVPAAALLFDLNGDPTGGAKGMHSSSRMITHSDQRPFARGTTHNRADRTGQEKRTDRTAASGREGSWHRPKTERLGA